MGIKIPILLNFERIFLKLKLLQEGIYVIGFYYPVVPKRAARIRVQISAGHEMEHLDKAIEAFTKVGKKLGVI